MELAEQRYRHWCAQKTLDPELRQELAAMQDPPVSKSAMNHRMRKLVALANES